MKTSTYTLSHDSLVVKKSQFSAEVQIFQDVPDVLYAPQCI